MTWPLIALAIPTIVIGWPWLILPLAEPVLEQMLAYGQPIRAIELGSAHWLAMGASILSPPRGSAGRSATTRAGGSTTRSTPCSGSAASTSSWSTSGTSTSCTTSSSSGRPWRWPARSSGFDRWVIDGVVNGSAYLTVLLSRLEGVFDRSGVDWAGQCGRPGRLRLRRLGPRHPDRPAPQLPDVPGRRAGRALRGHVRLDSELVEIRSSRRWRPNPGPASDPGPSALTSEVVSTS